MMVVHVFAFGIALTWGVAAPAQASPDCPDLAGHYRVDGFGPVLGDALQALRLQLAGFSGSEVAISGHTASTLEFRVRSGTRLPMSTQPLRTLKRGIDYECAGTSIMLKATVQASRQGDSGWLEGESTIHLSRSGQGLGLSAGFRGGERKTLYRYDSARVSIPKFGTTQRRSDSIRWPHISEPRPAEYVPTVESARLQALRRVLNASVLGKVQLGGLSERGNDVLASLSARRSDEVVAFEDRLRAAGIAYTVKREPIWSNNGYSMQFAFPDGDGVAIAAWRPSAFRVQQEVERMQHPMVSVGSVEKRDDDFVAALDVIGTESTEMILSRLRSSTKMFRAIEVVDDTPSERANLRHLQVRLTVH